MRRRYFIVLPLALFLSGNARAQSRAGRAVPAPPLGAVGLPALQIPLAAPVPATQTLAAPAPLSAAWTSLPTPAALAPTPPAAATSAAAAPASRVSPESEGGLGDYLDWLFDRGDARRPRGAAAKPPPSDPEADAAELARLAAPLKTAVQLERLALAPRAPGETFSFSIIGDIETAGHMWLYKMLFARRGVFPKLLQSVGREPLDFIMQLGDMVPRGTVGHFLRFLTNLLAIMPSQPYLTTIGNHDRSKPEGVSDSAVYRSVFGESTDYYFDRGDARIVVVDSSDRAVTQEQLAWLDGVLDTNRRKIVFTHIPPAPVFKTNGYWPSIFRDPKKFKRGAEEFTRIVSRRSVDRVYYGHIHGFDVLDHLGVRYVNTGGGGSPLFPGIFPLGRVKLFYHSITVEVGPAGITETVHKADGTSFVID